MTMYIPDNYDAFREHESKVSKAYDEYIESLPECCECGVPIEDDVCYKVFDDFFCLRCMKMMVVNTSEHRKER